MNYSTIYYALVSARSVIEDAKRNHPRTNDAKYDSFVDALRDIDSALSELKAVSP